MQYHNTTNPIIPHAPLSLERDAFKMQSFINKIAKGLIKKDAKTQARPKEYYIHGEDLLILPIK